MTSDNVSRNAERNMGTGAGTGASSNIGTMSETGLETRGQSGMGRMSRQDRLGGRATPLPWWLYLVTAAAWTALTWIALRFNTTSIRTIGILAGVYILVSAGIELLHMFTTGTWRVLHAVLALVFIGIGVVALVRPGNTFTWMAAFIGWYLLFKGAANLFFAFTDRGENDARALLFITGFVQLFFGFWAAGNFGRRVYILFLYVAVIALSHAVTDLAYAFNLRSRQRADKAMDTAIRDLLGGHHEGMRAEQRSTVTTGGY